MAVNADKSQARYIFGPYEILDTLGHGGMGVVYRAVDTSLGRPVALKILREDLRSRSRIVARFDREAKAFASLDHPNIVHIHSVGAIGKIPYIAMEFIDGSTVGDRLQANGPMPWQEAFRIGAQVADALACAHDAGIIHRDIKPGNILLNREDKAFVTDFGIAKVLTATTKLTVDGTRLGTPQYMSPERCRDEAVTPSSDLYALGVLLFQSISGRLPHEGGSSSEIIKQIVSAPPARLSRYIPDVPAPVERLVAYLLERKPADRPASAQVVREMLEQVLAGKSISSEQEELANALDAYRRSLESTTPSRESGPDSTPTEETSGHGARGRLRRWLLAALVGLLAFSGISATILISHRAGLSALPGTLTRPVHNDLSAWSAPVNLARFSRETDNVSIITHTAPGLRATPVYAEDGKVMVRLSGRDGFGLMWLNPGSQTGAYLLPPAEGATKGDAHFVGGWVERGRPVGILKHAEGVTSLGTPADAWADMEANTLLRAAVDAVALHTPVAWGGTPTLAVAMSRAAGGGTVQEMSVDAPLARETRLTLDERIRQMAYDESGGELATVSRDATGRDHLRVHRFASADAPETHVMDGTLALPAHPFRPGAEEILVRLGAESDRWAVITTDSGARRSILEEAEAAAWTPDGRGVLVVSPDRRGRNQLWRLEPSQPSNREQLTFLETGVGTALVVDSGKGLAYVPLAGGDATVAVALEEMRW